MSRSSANCQLVIIMMMFEFTALWSYWSYCALLPRSWWRIRIWKRWRTRWRSCPTNAGEMFPLRWFESLLEVCNTRLSFLTLRCKVGDQEPVTYRPPITHSHSITCYLIQPLVIYYFIRDCMAPAGTSVEGQQQVISSGQGSTKVKTCFKCHLEGHVSIFTLPL